MDWSFNSFNSDLDVSKPGINISFTTLPHDQHISTLILDGEEDLRYHDEDPSLVWRVDGPDTVHVRRVIPGVVG